MNVAFIPVRGGSKSIPLKNIKPMAGQPLVYWTLKAAAECRSIDQIYVSTDSKEIKQTISQMFLPKLNIIDRSPQTAQDTSSTESAMLEFAENYEFDNIVLIQATSPLLSDRDLDEGFKLFFQSDTDSVLSVVRQKRFNWGINDNGYAYALNYDYMKRPRRQDFNGYWVENGAYYITSRSALLATGNRISGNIKVYEMPEETYFEIDEPSDWIIVEQLLRKRQLNKTLAYINIKLVATDCDGVLTDGGMFYSANGEFAKRFSARDGMGFEILRKCGIKTAIITGEQHPLVSMRGQKLKIDDVILGEKDKLNALRQLCKKYGITLENVAYIGDDVFDLAAIQQCGFGCAPSDAQPQVLKSADYITLCKGGNGCFREVADIICNKLMLNQTTH
ncbi:HAD hydrolase family protein [Enterocloster asparagiformis]|uniref:HAD-IIIA family hydrolase n=1 Tax=Enterocloster asparagiformis TaxID=333367 RepID=UPI0034AA8A2B